MNFVEKETLSRNIRNICDELEKALVVMVKNNQDFAILTLELLSKTPKLSKEIHLEIDFRDRQNESKTMPDFGLRTKEITT